MNKLPNGRNTVDVEEQEISYIFFVLLLYPNNSYILLYAHKGVNLINNIFLQQNDNTQTGNNSNNAWEGPAPNDIHTEGEKVIKKACIATIGYKLDVYSLKCSALHVSFSEQFRLGVYPRMCKDWFEPTFKILVD